MKLIWKAVFTVCLALAADVSVAQPVAGATTIGVAVAEMQSVALGWSAKRQALGAVIYNDNNEKVGKVDDIIIAPDRQVSYFIVGAGGFVGLARHDVAIPVDQVQLENGKLVLAGATRDLIKQLPQFEYAKKGASN